MQRSLLASSLHGAQLHPTNATCSLAPPPLLPSASLTSRLGRDMRPYARESKYSTRCANVMPADDRGLPLSSPWKAPDTPARMQAGAGIS